LFAALFQISCHSSRQNLEVQGLDSDAGNFMLVTGRLRAALVAVSALSLNGMHKTICTLPCDDVTNIIIMQLICKIIQELFTAQPN